MYKVVPFLNVYLRRIGDNAGSKSSPTFSSKTGLPNYIEFSKVLR
jgi:hypothetical protein